jgi:hypothetical protein
LVLGVDGGAVDEGGVNNRQAVGYVAVNYEGELVKEVFGGRNEGVDGFGDVLGGNQGLVEFGVFAAQQLKPENILVQLKETVIVINFGLQQVAMLWSIYGLFFLFNIALLPLFHLLQCWVGFLKGWVNFL